MPTKKQAKLRKSHIIYDLLHEYQLDKPEVLPDALRKLTGADWLSFSDRLEAWYEENVPTQQEIASGFTPTTFCFPVLPASLIDRISSHLLISDRVFLDDPLYEIAAILGSTEPTMQLVVRCSREKVWKQAQEYIQFYLKARQLVDEGRLIPYKESILMPKAPAVSFMKLLYTTLKSDKRLSRLLGAHHPLALYRWDFLTGYLLWRLRRKGSQTDFLSEWVPGKRTKELLAAYALTVPTLGSLATFSLFGGLRGLSTDFITKEIAFLYRRCLEIAELVNRQLPEIKRLPLPGAYSKQTFNFPLLCDVPIERVLDTILMEPDAFESFRASVNEKLLGISAPPGSLEREQQIARIQEQIREDIAEISIAYRSIQQRFQRKWAINVLLGSFSILVAGLSVSTHNLNALAIAGSIAGGAGITASLKELAQEWLEYQAELSELKTRDNFFVWRLLSKHRWDASR